MANVASLALAFLLAGSVIDLTAEPATRRLLVQCELDFLDGRDERITLDAWEQTLERVLQQIAGAASHTISIDTSVPLYLPILPPVGEFSVKEVLQLLAREQRLYYSVHASGSLEIKGEKREQSDRPCTPLERRQCTWIIWDQPSRPVTRTFPCCRKLIVPVAP